MEENSQTQFVEFEIKNIERRKLLPVWIKVFCWIFMLMGLVSIGCLIFGMLGGKADLSFYGFETDEPLTLIGIFIISMMILKGFSAYALWFEKDYAIKLGKMDAVLGIIICIFSMFVLPFIKENSNFVIRLEIALLIPYFMKLNKIKNEWENLETK